MGVGVHAFAVRDPVSCGTLMSEADQQNSCG